MKDLVAKAKRWREWQVFSKIWSMYSELEENQNLIEPYQRDVLHYWTWGGSFIIYN